MATVSDGPMELHLALCVGTNFAREDGSGGLLILEGPNNLLSCSMGVEATDIGEQKHHRV